MQELQDDIILAFRQGDEAAFDAIFEHFYEPIITFCKCMVPAEDAEDITSDVFFRLWKLRASWDSIKNVRAFLYVSARNGCFDFLRAQKIRLEKQKEIAQLIAHEEDFINYSEIETEIISRIKYEIRNLPENCRMVFTMFYFDGYENAEIAENLSLSYQTVRNLKTTALNALRKTIFRNSLQLSAIVLIIYMLVACSK